MSAPVKNISEIRCKSVRAEMYMKMKKEKAKVCSSNKFFLKNLLKKLNLSL